MPVIRPSADLRNKYNEISELCHEYSEPVFITKNGTGDLAVMSIETYELLAGKLELYKLIQEGIDDVENGRTLKEQDILKNAEIILGK
jgi:prevent-host-death family protein